MKPLLFPPSSASKPTSREARRRRASVSTAGVEAALPARTDSISPQLVAAGVPPQTSRRGKAAGGAELRVAVLKTPRLFALLLLLPLLATAADPIALASRRELFVDRLLIDKLTGAAELRLHEPQPREVALKFDQPWEGRFSAYITVLHDERAGTFRMYYRGNNVAKDGGSGECTCYAESPDGIRWTKPNLGFHEIAGSRENNVMLAQMPPYTHNFAPFLDRRAGVPDDQRFKALAGLGGKNGGLCAFASGDGLHWRKLQEAPVITKGAFDSQNVSFWSEAEQCYVAYFRIFTGGTIDAQTWAPKGVRWVSRATSPDFVQWSDPIAMTCDQPLVDHIYISQTQPYVRAPHYYLSTAARFMPGKAVLDAGQKATLADDAKKYPTLTHDCSEAVLMTSRAGSTLFNRTFMEALIRPGPDYRNWTSRSNYPACGVVETSPTELSLFVERQYGQSAAHLQRFTLRTDGFASLHAAYAGGETLTHPLTFTGKELRVNAATGVTGSIAIELQDAAGQPLPGFAAAECNAFTGDDTDLPVTWKTNPDLSALAGQPIRLRILLKDADLYALQFR
jgi:hypothetical protein